jgi:two-component system phosphate regulon sensor histidine kinase PhoR
MNKTRLNIIIALMGVAVIGLIVIQAVWIIRMYNAEEQRFSNYVNESLISLTRTLQKREVAKIFLDKVSPDSTQIFVWNEKQTPKIKYDRNLKIVVNDNKTDDVIIDSANVYTYKYEYEKKDTLNEEKLSFVVKFDSLLGNKTTIVKEVFTEFVNIRKSPEKKEIDLKLIDSLLSSELSQRGINLKYNIVFDKGRLNSENDTGSDKQFSAYLFPNDVVPNNTLINVSFENRAGYFIEAIGLMAALSILFIVLIIVVFYQTIKMLIKQKKITDIKNDLINNITHEFKTPISTIAIACEALNEPELSDKRSFLEKYTSMIKYENNRLKNLVDNLLNTAVCENDQIKLKKSDVDINELIREVINSFDEKLGEKNGEIKFDQNEKIMSFI